MSEAAAAGSTLLTDSAGTPAPDMTPQDGAVAALLQAREAPPEWAVAKYWDAQRAKDPGWVEEYAKTVSTGYRNAEQLIGRDKIPVPLSDDDAEGWDRWYTATGRPDTPDEYEFERPSLPPEMSYDEDAEKYLRTHAHQNGLNKKQTKAFYDGFVKMQIERQTAYAQYQQQAKQEALVKLQREHGPQFDNAMTSAKGIMSKYADPDFRTYLDESGLGNDPRMLRVLAKIGKDVTGETRLQGRPLDNTGPADLDLAIANFDKQHEKALWDKSHPEHNLRLGERKRLFEQRWADA